MLFYVIKNDDGTHPFSQVCQAATPSARPALHRPKVSGAPVLLQADWGHAYRHLPDGDAGGSASDHMTPVAPLPPCIYSHIVSDMKMELKKDLIQIIKQHILYLAKHCKLNLKKYFEIVGRAES